MIRTYRPVRRGAVLVLVTICMIALMGMLALAIDIGLVFSSDGRPVARVRAGDRGRYSVRLRPGPYTVRLATQPKIGSGLSPRLVRLPAVTSVRVNFSIDTGIR